MNLRMHGAPLHNSVCRQTRADSIPNTKWYALHLIVHWLQQSHWHHQLFIFAQQDLWHNDYLHLLLKFCTLICMIRDSTLFLLALKLSTILSILIRQVHDTWPLNSINPSLWGQRLHEFHGSGMRQLCILGTVTNDCHSLPCCHQDLGLHLCENILYCYQMIACMNSSVWA